MHLNLKNGKIAITMSRFDPAAVRAIKTITGRIWNMSLKRWEVPLEHVDEALRVLEPLGAIAHVDVKRAAERERNVLRTAQEIKEWKDVPYHGLFPLYEFQKKGAMFLATMDHSLLADAPGLGKSLQTLAAIEQNARPGPHLILAPASLKYSWADEIKKWSASADLVVVDGDKDERRTQWFYALKKTFVIANYELLLHDFNLINSTNWSTIVCDEATRISNSEAKTTKALKSLQSGKRIALTGTPISNSPVDIYSIIDWLMPKYLGTLWQFKKKYCVLNDFHEVVGYKNLDDLSSKVSRFMLRRTKEEVLTDFPRKTIQDIVFPLSEGEAKLYDNVRKLIIEELSHLTVDKSTLMIAPVKMLRLKQITDHPNIVGSGLYSTKLKILEDLIEPIVASGEKVIVFTQFAEMLKILMAKLSKFSPVPIYGELPAADRQEYVRRFNNDPRHKVIVMTEAGAYGLNLQAASTVVHYDLPWSIAKMQQREDRAHRIGQTKPVTVYNLLAKGTVDEYVAKVLHKKNKASVEILQDESRLASAGLSEEDVRSILKI